MPQGKDSWSNAVHHPTDDIIEVTVLSPAMLMMNDTEIIGDYWYQTPAGVIRDEVCSAEFCRTFGRIGDPGIVLDNARRLWRDDQPRQQDEAR